MVNDMKEFRIVFKNGYTEWLNASEWSINDLMQFQELGDYQVEYR